MTDLPLADAGVRAEILGWLDIFSGFVRINKRSLTYESPLRNRQQLQGA